MVFIFLVFLCFVFILSCIFTWFFSFLIFDYAVILSLTSLIKVLRDYFK